jgi:hypothetical protein
LLLGAAAVGCSSSPPPAEVPDGSPEATVDCPNDLPGNGDCATAAPSYDVDVAPIIATRCTICHTPGGMETSRLFGSYDQAYALRREMLTQIYACLMPKPPALPLTPDERHIMLKWFVCGAPGPADAAAH